MTEAPKRAVLLHGLFRTRMSLRKMARALEADGYEVWNLSYPSNRRSIPEHAADIAARLAELRAADAQAPIDIVTHSLGGIVARALMANHAEALPPVRRVVQLAPPNQGAQIVDRLKGLWLFQAVAGEAGMQLSREQEGPGEETGRYRLPEGVELGIIAGGRGDEKGYAPWLKGDNDGVVEVDATALAGAADRILVRHIHTFIMNASDTIANTRHFFERGRFLEEAARLEVCA